MSKRLLLLAIAALLLLVAACTQENIVQREAPPTQPPALVPAAPLVSSPPANLTQPLDARRELRGLLNASRAQGSTVSYRVSFEGDDPTQADSITIYSDANEVRMDSTLRTANGSFPARNLVVERTPIACVQEKSVWRCFNLSGVEPVQEDLARADDAFWSVRAVTKAAGRRIAGVDASCYDVVIAAEELEELVCVSPEGVLLLTRTKLPLGTMTQEATSYALGVPDGVFTLPAKVEQAPATQN